MRSIATILALVGTLCFTGELRAQEGPEAELRAMVSEPLEADLHRQSVQDFLDRTDVSRAAREYGLDLDRIKDAVETLDPDAARDLAERVRDTEAQLPETGGDTYVISSTAVIIGLLVLILILVA